VLVPRYADTGIFICRRQRFIPAGGELFRKRRISYAYYMGWQLTNTAGALSRTGRWTAGPGTRVILCFPSRANRRETITTKYGGNFLFCDGRIESTPAATFVSHRGHAKASCS